MICNFTNELSNLYFDELLIQEIMKQTYAKRETQNIIRIQDVRFSRGNQHYPYVNYQKG